MFAIRRSSTSRGDKFNNEEVVDSGPIDEVQGLRSIFSDFFNASAKNLNQQKDLMISTQMQETSINPFFVLP